MTTPFRWGILGTGGIAHKFATGLSVLSDAQLVAVGSRTQASADKFADEFKAPNRHASYEALASDPEVEAIYIATPHPFHKDNTLLCLNAGKAVLVEKPFAINAAEAQQMISLSRQKKVFLMEAMWSRFLPAIVRARELIASGAIGEVRMLNADFGFRTNYNPNSRLFDLALGGGALLDVGIYPISLAFALFGTPKTINAQAHFSETGADDQNAIVFSYDQGQLALLSSASRTNTAHEAIIYGTDGSIRIPDWWHGQKLIVSTNGKPTETLDVPHLGNGYPHEAIEVAACVRAGKIESNTMPLDESLTIMQTMDTIRSQWGLKYPTE
ncbi:MAG: gfo/Idh/MocA family oxidoreductase [Anaerolineaceae bacterium]|nr:gfo/Idh/MocA family oxidoreductase [Anaerolineaceae bacterium]